MSPLRTLWRSCLIIIQASPIRLGYLVLLNFIGGIRPTVVIFFNKIVIDEVARLSTTEVTGDIFTIIFSHPSLLWSTTGIVISNLLVVSIDVTISSLTSSLRDLVQNHTQKLILHKIANFNDIALFENYELLNTVHMAESAVKRLQQLVLFFCSTITGFFVFIPAVSISALLAWWVPPMMIVSSVPSLYVRQLYKKRSWRVEVSQAATVRKMDIFARVLTGEEYAKEIRLFRLQSLLLSRWQNLFSHFFSTMEQVRKQGTLVAFAWSFYGGVGIVLPYIYVLIGALYGKYTLGDLSLYAGLILTVRQSLNIIISSYVDLYDVALDASPIFDLLELKPQLQLSLPPHSNLKSFNTGIQIENLSFSYPNSKHQILENINLKIHSNEVIALVGKNGAGKTTLAKLLCRLYDPTKGSIEWNGQDLRSLDPDTLHARIAVVMQDYARFPATLRENVAFGALSKLHDDNAVSNAISEAGISGVINCLSQGLDTPIGKQSEEGVDFSGGEWQRIAIARALIRMPEAELLVFDEPTSALDPQTEHEIYNIFRKAVINNVVLRKLLSRPAKDHACSN